MASAGQRHQRARTQGRHGCGLDKVNPHESQLPPSNARSHLRLNSPLIRSLIIRNQCIISKSVGLCQATFSPFTQREFTYYLCWPKLHLASSQRVLGNKQYARDPPLLSLHISIAPRAPRMTFLEVLNHLRAATRLTNDPSLECSVHIYP